MSESSNLDFIAGKDHDEDIITTSSSLKHSTVPIPPVYKDPGGNIGFERHDLVRIVTKFLGDMGYQKTAQELENESGIQCESSHVSDILNAIVQGKWDIAIDLVQKVKLNTNISLVELLILERKFAEYLECDDLDAALNCLRLELVPRAPIDNNDERNIHTHM